MSQVLDLDKFRPESLDFTLGNKEFHIMKIPMDISLDFYELIPIFTELETSKKLKKADYFKILQLKIKWKMVNGRWKIYSCDKHVEKENRD